VRKTVPRPVQFVDAGKSYFGTDFKPTQTPTSWLLKPANISVNYGHGQMTLYGYWIFRSDGVNRCWQAVNGGGAGLAYWNQDGLAQGNPEDWEMFKFFAVAENQGTVRIQNFGSPPNGGHFIILNGDTFYCNTDGDHATIFTLQFP
jgi:hypothetical protein